MTDKRSTKVPSTPAKALVVYEEFMRHSERAQEALKKQADAVLHGNLGRARELARAVDVATERATVRKDALHEFLKGMASTSEPKRSSPEEAEMDPEAIEALVQAEVSRQVRVAQRTNEARSARLRREAGNPWRGLPAPKLPETNS